MQDAVEGATDNRLLERLAAEPMFAEVDMQSLADQSRFVGRAPEQVDRFLEEVVEPIRSRYRDSFPSAAELNV